MTLPKKKTKPPEKRPEREIPGSLLAFRRGHEGAVAVPCQAEPSRVRKPTEPPCGTSGTPRPQRLRRACMRAASTPQPDLHGDIMLASNLERNRHPFTPMKCGIPQDLAVRPRRNAPEKPGLFDGETGHLAQAVAATGPRAGMANGR